MAQDSVKNIKHEYFDEFDYEDMKEYYRIIQNGEFKVQYIDKKVHELSKEELDKYLKYSYGYYKFTPETCTKEQAIELAKHYKRQFAPRVFPLEYLDDANFIKQLAEHGINYYNYTSPRLRDEDYELASFMIDKFNGNLEFFSPAKDLKGSKIAKNNEFIINEARKPRYKTDSKTGQQVPDYDKFLTVANDLAYACGNVCNKETAKTLIEANPRSYYELRDELKLDKEIIIETAESMLNHGDFSVAERITQVINEFKLRNYPYLGEKKFEENKEIRNIFGKKHTKIGRALFPEHVAPETELDNLLVALLNANNSSNIVHRMKVKKVIEKYKNEELDILLKQTNNAKQPGDE